VAFKGATQEVKFFWHISVISLRSCGLTYSDQIWHGNTGGGGACFYS